MDSIGVYTYKESFNTKQKFINYFRKNKGIFPEKKSLPVKEPNCYITDSTTIKELSNFIDKNKQ